MSKIGDILGNFSFSDTEAKIYLAVLALGRPSVSEIAKKVGINRTAAYFHLKKLLERRLIQETREGKKLCFIAVKPTDLAEIFDRWTIDFKSFVPQLEALKEIEQETPTIEITESKRGYFKVYDEISTLPEKSMFRVLEGCEGLIDEIGLLSEEEWKKFFSRIVERKIETRGLFTEECLEIPSRTFSKENLEILRKRIWHLRVLPESILPIKHLSLIYGNKVAFLFPETSLVITIKHKGITEFLSATFDGLFNFSKKIEQAWHDEI